MVLRKCPVCGGKLRSEALGWICYDCQGFIDMQGVFHEHKEKPFMPPQTNADRIRAMSDEEFSCFLALVENRKTGKTIFDDTSDFWLEWLQQPAK